MKKIEVLQASGVEVKPFVASNFVQACTDMPMSGKVSKKVLKRLAKEQGLSFDDESLTFAKKLLEAYVAKKVKV